MDTDIWFVALLGLGLLVEVYNVKIATDCDGPVCLYLYNNTARPHTWQESHDACRAEGFHLLSIKSHQIQTAVERLLTDVPKYLPLLVWTAGRGSSHDTWEYMNGTDFPRGVIGSGQDAHCVYVRLYRKVTNNIYYNKDNCDEKLSPSQVICQYDASSTATGNCTHPDMSWQGKCYRKTKYDGKGKQRVDWFGAQSHCSGGGINGDIVYSNLDTLRTALMDMVARTKQMVRLWAGVRRRIWYWRSGSDDVNDMLPMAYFNWAGTFGKYSEHGNCVYIDHTKKNTWSVTSCTAKLRLFICMGDQTVTTCTTTSTSTTTTITTNPALTSDQTTTSGIGQSGSGTSDGGGDFNYKGESNRKTKLVMRTGTFPVIHLVMTCMPRCSPWARLMTSLSWITSCTAESPQMTIYPHMTR